MAITWNDVPVVDSIQLPGSSDKYWVKDTEARQKIEDLVSATHFLGVTTTALTDESTTNPIVINGEEVTAVSGDITIYKQTDHVSLEFIFDGTYWQLLGGQAIEGAGALAYVDTASTDYTPDGNVLLNVITSDKTNIVTDVSLGNLNWTLEESSGYSDEGIKVLTDVTVDSSSNFVTSVDYSTISCGKLVSAGSLPSLTNVGVSGIDASISGTTLVFGSATVSYTFDGGSFPEYSFASQTYINGVNDGNVNVGCSTSSTYLYLSKTGNLSVSSGWLDATFSGSTATITVSASSNS